MILGTIAALAVGTVYPVFAYVLGLMTDTFAKPEDMVELSKSTMLIFIYVGIGAFFFSWLMIATWMITS